MKNLGKWILQKAGWKICVSEKLPDKCIICVAPHTSNWDFVWGLCFKSQQNIHARFLMKEEWFAFPLGHLMRKLGGIAVNRSKKNSLTDQIAEAFKKYDNMQIAITPEGTRKYNPEWKKGFYYIACKAGVPIVLAFIDYKTKELGYNKIFYPTGNFEEDIVEIKDFYKSKTGKFPDQFGY